MPKVGENSKGSNIEFVVKLLGLNVNQSGLPVLILSFGIYPLKPPKKRKSLLVGDQDRIDG